MSALAQKKILALVGTFLVVWLGIRYLLPVILPFLLGAGLALAADPLVNFFQSRFHFKRLGATCLGISLVLIGILGILALLGMAAYWELGSLAWRLPGILDELRDSWSYLAQWLLGLASRAPTAIGTILTGWVEKFSVDSSNLLDQASSRLLGMAGNLLSVVPNGLFMLGTAILSAFMISAKLPRLRKTFQQHSPPVLQNRWIPMLQSLRRALGGWLRAEIKLAGITFVIVFAGLLLLRVPYAIVWSLIIAIVDAVPMLGTGTVLLPWALLCLIRRDTARAIGLVSIYLVAMLTRSSLEPRLVGRQLGLDPLITLCALYAGFRLWGVGGMLLSPILAVTAMQLCELWHHPAKN